MRLIYHPAAEAELIEAIQFYGRVDPELGARFIVSVDRAIQIISEGPDRWKIVAADVRRYLARDFPLAIFIACCQTILRLWLLSTTVDSRITGLAALAIEADH
jgi:toxin ParE1/3/4